MNERLIRAGAIAGIVAIAWFLAGTAIAGGLRTNYSWVAQPASDLGRGPHWWLFTVVLGFFALLIAVFGLALSQVVRNAMSGRRRRAARASLLVAAGGAAIGAVFSEYRPGDTAVWHGILHGLGFALLMLGTIVAEYIVAPGLARRPFSPGMTIYTRISATVSLLLLLVDLIPTVATDTGGLLQRILLVQTFAWHIVVGARLSAGGATTAQRGATIQSNPAGAR
jgi:hypothetical membrane protein